MQAGPPPGEPGRRIGGPGWALPALSAVTLAPALIWAVRQTQPTLVTAAMVQGVLIGSGALHLAVHLLTRRGALGLLAPPWAWSELLSGREAFGDRRATWLADVVAGTILSCALGVALAVRSDVAVLVPALVAVGLLLIATASRLAHVRGRATWSLTWLICLVPRIIGGMPRLLVSGGR